MFSELFFFLLLPQFLSLGAIKTSAAAVTFPAPASSSSAEHSRSPVTAARPTFLSSRQQSFFSPAPLQGHMFIATIARFFSSQPPGSRPDTPPGGPQQQGELPVRGLVPPFQAEPRPRPQQRPARGSEQPPPRGGPHQAGGQHAGAGLAGALRKARRRQPS